MFNKHKENKQNYQAILRPILRKKRSELTVAEEALYNMLSYDIDLIAELLQEWINENEENNN